MRILVVDDEPDILEAMSGLLHQRFNMDITVASNGQEAVQLLEESEFEHVLTDHRMPVMTGRRLLETIRERWPDMEGTMLTAYRDEELEAAIRAMGFGFVEKGYDLDDLLRTFQRISR